MAMESGHLEFSESFEQCAEREVLEETGLHLGKPSFAAIMNSVFSATSHFVTIFMRKDVEEDAEAQNMEPDKCAGWQWVPFRAIPEPVFLPLRQLLASSYELHPGSSQ
eukprot:jgi/Astpho2/9779/Aster-x1606